MYKSPSVAYYEKKILITSRRKLRAELEDAPLKARELDFVLDIVEGFSIKELAQKYNICRSRAQKKKKELFERLHRYDLAQAK